MVYGCCAHARNHSCGNAVELPETTMDTAVLESLARALEPDAIEAAVRQAVEDERAERAGSAERRHALERELALIDARTARPTEAVASGGAAVGPLLRKIGDETTRRQAAEMELGKLDALDGAADFASAAVRRALLRQASQVRAALLADAWPVRHANSCQPALNRSSASAPALYGLLPEADGVGHPSLGSRACA
jgi:hypothetical protein